MPASARDLDLSSYFDREWLRLYESYLPEALRWWEKNTSTKSAYGVEQTTARSYSTGVRGEYGPVAVFNEWAKYQVEALERDANWRQVLATPEGFARAHAGFGASLAEHWKNRVSGISSGARAGARIAHELSVGQKYKFVDLFVRYLWVERSDRKLSAQENLPHAHAPLDRKSLHVLSACYNGILLAPKFTMGMVVNEEQYRFCQALVQRVCDEVGGTPLLFDVFAWHHPAANALYGAAPGYKKKSSDVPATRRRTGESRPGA